MTTPDPAKRNVNRKQHGGASTVRGTFCTYKGGGKKDDKSLKRSSSNTTCAPTCIEILRKSPSKRNLFYGFPKVSVILQEAPAAPIPQLSAPAKCDAIGRANLERSWQPQEGPSEVAGMTGRLSQMEAWRSVPWCRC